MRRLSLSLIGIAGAWLLLDLWRLWTPSLITLFGRAAETPPEVMGLYALAVMAVPLVAVLLLPRSGPRLAGLLLAAALVVRVLLQLNPDGGDIQLYGSSLGVALTVTALCIAAGSFGRRLVPSVFLGVAISTATHAVMGGFGAVWRHDEHSIALLIVQAVLVAFAVREGLRTRDCTPAAARTGFLLLPVLLITLLALSNVGRASTIDETWGPAVVVLGAGAAAVVALLPSPRRRPWIAAVLFTASAALSLLPEVTGSPTQGGVTPWALLGFAVGPAAASRLLVFAGPGRTRYRTMIATGGGAVLWTVLFFAFYAGYDLGYRADAVLVAVCALMAIWVPAYRPGGAPDDADARRSERRMDDSGARAVTGVAIATVVAAAIATVAPNMTVPTVPATAASADQAGLTVAAYNLRMGYGLDGTFDPLAVARQIRASGARVVLLSEVDRGWLLNGGQDELAILQRMLGMHAVFGPAGDQVWGDAILTDLPLSAASKTRYPMFDALTGAGMTAATVTWRGQQVRVIATHLQPDGDRTDETTRQAKLFAEALAAVGGPVIGGGDLNTTRGSDAWAALTASGAQDAFADAADQPDIDHLLVSGLTADNAQVIDSPLSDHPMIVATFR